MHLKLNRIDSPLGTILLVTDGEAVRALDFHDYEARMLQLLRLQYGAYTLTPAAGAVELAQPIQAYFDGEIAALDRLPIQTAGTAFQRLVWAELRLIPLGTTTTYGALAQRIGRPNASRAVGMANGANPVSIAIPCHRVIGADASLTGYGGGLHRKEWLLAHERRHAQPA